MDKEKIKEYYDSCSPLSIERIIKSKLDNGEINTSYFRKTRIEREKLFNERIDKEDFDLNTKKRLKEESRQYSILFDNIVVFYDAVCNYQKTYTNNQFDKAEIHRTKINLHLLNIKQAFAVLEYQKFFIRDLVNNGKYNIAIRVKYYCINLAEYLLSYFKQWLHINLLKSPLKDYFKPHLKAIRNSINTEEINIEKNNTNTKKIETQEKHKIILAKLNEYKFDELEKVSDLDIHVLSSHVFSNDLPYQIAYLQYLQFTDYLLKHYCQSKKIKLHKLLANILNTTERAIRGNLNVLNPISKEDKSKYTSYQHKEKVKEHYLTIK